MTDFGVPIAVLLTSVVIMSGALLIVKSFLDKQLEEERTRKSVELSKDVLPLRLQAGERMCIFLERIAPNSLIVRLNDSSYNVAQFQHLLLTEIRNEFNHNLSQQVYLSEESWGLVRKATEEVIALINNSAHGLDREAPSIELAKRIFERVLEKDEDVSNIATRYIKQEIRQIF